MSVACAADGCTNQAALVQRELGKAFCSQRCISDYRCDTHQYLKANPTTYAVPIGAPLAAVVKRSLSAAGLNAEAEMKGKLHDSGAHYLLPVTHVDALIWQLKTIGPLMGEPDKEKLEALYAWLKDTDPRVDWRKPQFLAHTISVRLIRRGLKALPPEIGQLTELQELVLGNNELLQLPPEIGQLTALKTLDLTSNQLIVLPQEIGRLSALRGLYLHENKLASLPSSLASLGSLSTLVISNNAFSDFPDVITDMTNLTELNISGNRLTKLPSTIGELRQLEVLNVARTDVSVLPITITKLTKLNTLLLTDSKITEIPSGLLALPMLIIVGKGRLGWTTAEIRSMYIRVYQKEPIDEYIPFEFNLRRRQ